jgi:hypothetical protein
VKPAIEHAEIERDRYQHENIEPDPKKGCSHSGFACRGLGRGTVGIRGVQIGQLDPRAAPRLDDYGHIPAQP